AHDHFHAVDDRHVRDLPHDHAHLTELIQELLDIMRLHAAPRGDAATPAEIDHVWVFAFILGHRIDHALHALDGDIGILALGDQLAHARHVAHDLLHAAHLGHLRELLAEVVEIEITFRELLLLGFDFFLRQL